MKKSQTNGAASSQRPSVAYILDPRFPGGTSAAVAQELDTIAKRYQPKVYAVDSGMFTGRDVAPVLARSLKQNGIELVWEPTSIQADVVILHNPAFLKFSQGMNAKILTHRLLVISHENFVRPGGALGFDVAGCLDQIDDACVFGEKIIAPISPYNRETVVQWQSENSGYGHWQIADDIWFNICDFEFSAPTSTPKDRRGRLSRPGFEKFPSIADMELCFSNNATANTILGADNFIDHALDHPHWRLVPFRGMEVSEFMGEIDFMVYFTSPSWRESFGRVIAESSAAGKVVITDPETAAIFGDGVISAEPKQVDAIIAGLLRDPGAYADHVKRAQETLRTYGAAPFLTLFERRVEQNQKAKP